MTVDLWHETNEKVKDWDMAELLIREGLAIYGIEADQFTPKIPLEGAKPTSHAPAAVQSTTSASIASASISNPAATTPESAPLIVDPNASTSCPHQAEVTQLLFASEPPATEMSAAPSSEQQQMLFINASPAAPQQVSTLSFTSSALPPQPLVLSASAPRLPPWADPTWQPEPLFASTKALSHPSQVFTKHLSPPTSSSFPAQSSSTNSCPITTGTALSFFNSPQSYSLWFMQFEKVTHVFCLLKLLILSL